MEGEGSVKKQAGSTSSSHLGTCSNAPERVPGAAMFSVAAMDMQAMSIAFSGLMTPGEGEKWAWRADSGAGEAALHRNAGPSTLCFGVGKKHLALLVA